MLKSECIHADARFFNFIFGVSEKYNLLLTPVVFLFSLGKWQENYLCSYRKRVENTK
jgi:hypothetical protein